MRKIRMGMIGGGTGSFIGGVHRMVAAIDGQIELVCGAFSSNAEKSITSGKALMLPKDRVYGSFQEMIEKEKQLPEDIRMDFVSVVTPNYMHFAPVKMALENGFHVVCDKPVSFNLKEALELKKIIQESELEFALTHNYTAYPMVKQAKDLINNDTLGKIRKVIVEYSQGWLATKLEDSGQKQAAWRVDPKRSGAGGAIGDIGTHAKNLAEYITGLKITELCADLTTFVEGRLLDDDANILLHFEGGAKGILHTSQICVGEENNLNIRVYGEKAGIEWHQQEPNSLKVMYLDQPFQVYRTGSAGATDYASSVTRIPAGHPEGYLEAFATIYKNFASVLQKHNKGEQITGSDRDYPSIEEGIRGMLFIDKVIESSEAGQKWVKMEI